jgi:hypothetical protein
VVPVVAGFVDCLTAKLLLLAVSILLLILPIFPRFLIQISGTKFYKTLL